MWFEKIIYYIGNKLVVYIGEKYLWKLMIKSKLEKKNKYLTDELNNVYGKLLEDHDDDDYVLVDFS